MCNGVIYKEKWLAYSIYPYKKNGNWKHLKLLCFPLSDLKQLILIVHRNWIEALKSQKCIDKRIIHSVNSKFVIFTIFSQKQIWETPSFSSTRPPLCFNLGACCHRTGWQVQQGQPALHTPGPFTELPARNRPEWDSTPLWQRDTLTQLCIPTLYLVGLCWLFLLIQIKHYCATS